MCDTADDGVGIGNSIPHDLQLRNNGLRTADISALMPFARQLANSRENRDSHIGFVGYDKTKAGNKILIAIDREYDLDVPHAVAAALREKGAHVDLLVADMGSPDRVFDYTDEVEVIMRREPWENNPRRWEGRPYIEDFALRGGYDLLIHGKGGPIPKTEFRYEQIPWLRAEHFLQRSTTYPLDLHLLINKKTWDPIWEYGRGGRARLTDAEGTDISWTYWDEYYDGTRYGFSATPRNGHLFGHPVPPIIAKEDAAGMVAGTTSHFSNWAARPTAMRGALCSMKVEIPSIHVFRGPACSISGKSRSARIRRSCGRAASRNILRAVLSGSGAARA
ncbi:MAG: hypothetical protein HW419_197 [Deltaproteobacteria bacterium]|nr:hypothetical protein [Deltaproteobacteria bacterium]